MKSRTIGARNGDQNMEKNEIRGYEPLVEELKQLIHKKQYHVLKVINAETIIFTGKLEKRFINSSKKKDGGNLLFRFYQENYKKNSLEQRDISSKFVENAELLFNISSFRKTRIQWCEKLAGAIILLLWRNAKTI